MTQVFSNFAQSNLVAGITDSATSFSVTPTEGGQFAALNTSEYQLVTLTDGVYWEVVKVTARTGDNFTVVRGYEGNARAWGTGTYVRAQVTKATMDNLLQFEDFGGAVALYLHQNFR